MMHDMLCSQASDGVIVTIDRSSDNYFFVGLGYGIGNFLRREGEQLRLLYCYIWCIGSGLLVASNKDEETETAREESMFHSR
jgi:hypothetical protein